jgi:molecular chaperone DnaJ
MGDLRATLEVTVPQDLSKKAKSALEDLRIATEGADPREELLRKARLGG